MRLNRRTIGPMSLFYKPQDGWLADVIPFYWQGVYHLYYLKDFRNVETHGEGTPWCHLTTRDFVSFTDHGEILPRGGPDDQDLFVFTGSVIEHAGQFHIFYTGHNPHFEKQGKPAQAVMHAVSADLHTWRKVPEDTFYAPADQYEPHDWRDPFVFWNDDAGEFCMLLAARLKDGPSRRRGCTAHVLINRSQALACVRAILDARPVLHARMPRPFPHRRMVVSRLLGIFRSVRHALSHEPVAARAMAGAGE